MTGFLTPEDLTLIQGLTQRVSEAHDALGVVDTNDKRVSAAMYWALMAVPMLDAALVAKPPHVRASLMQWGAERLQEAHNAVAKVILGERLKLGRERN